MLEYFIIAIVQGLICGFVSDYIAKEKGYDSKMYFWLGFFFSVIGIIVAAVQTDRGIIDFKPNKNTPLVSNETNKSTNIIIDKWYNDLPFELLQARIVINKMESESALYLEWINLGDKSIKSIYLDIACFDDVGDPVCENNIVHYAYQDMKVGKNQIFGTDEYIKLCNERVRKIDISFNKMSFNDDEIVLRLDDIADKKERLPLISISQLDTERMKIVNASVEINNNFPHLFIPNESKDRLQWRCCCGKVNGNDKDICCRCNRSKLNQFNVFDEEFICNAIKENEKKQVYLNMQATNKKHKLAIITGSVIIILMVVGLLGYYKIVPSIYYNNGIQAMKENDYEGAVVAFNKIYTDYKDSSALKYLCIEVGVDNPNLEDVSYNSSLYAINKGWIYTIYSDGSLYKNSSDMSKKEKISAINKVGKVACEDEWLYYISTSSKDISSGNIYKIKVDGTENMLLDSGLNINIYLNNSKLYFTVDKESEDDTIFRMDLDGNNKEYVAKGFMDGIINNVIYCQSIRDDSLSAMQINNNIVQKKWTTTIDFYLTRDIFERDGRAYLTYMEYKNGERSLYSCELSDIGVTRKFLIEDKFEFFTAVSKQYIYYFDTAGVLHKRFIN